MADGFARKPRREKKLIAKNRSAHHEYFIDETFECGLELAGTEVRSLRERACQITDSFALIRNGECWLHNVHIHPYSNGSIFNRDPDRRRKLLLHRKQIDYLDGKLRVRGVALVPLELYFNEDGRVKLLLGLGRGKKLYDKREDMAKRLDGKLRVRGVALVPLELYFNEDGRVKLLLGLGRGKKLYDKREDMAKRDMQREIDRALKQRSR